MQRPYISGPMTSYQHHNFPLFFRVDEKLKQFDYDPLNPARNTGDTWESAYQYALDNPQTWEAYIRKDTEAVLKSDGMVLLPGWERSKGACLEVVVSICIGNVIYTWHDIDDPGSIKLDPVDRADVYQTALRHLSNCGLGGVNLSSDGYAKYVEKV